MTLNDPRDDPKYKVGGNQYKPPYERTDDAPSPAVVKEFHEKSDVDSSQVAQHHTLGSKNGQAAAGDHNHGVGSPYKKPLAGTTITGSRSALPGAIPTIIAALVKLGATDSSTP